jgi:hypothetical protein
MNNKFTIKLKTPLEWRSIPSHPDYQASNYGRVKSFKNDKINGRILKASPNSHGYLQVIVYTNGKRTHKKVHQLIAECFLAYPEGAKIGEYSVDHINRNKFNNCLSNLRYATNSEQAKNKHKRENCTSIYKGVSKYNNRWKCDISINGKQIYLGSYATKLEAGQAYNDYVTANNLPNELNDLSK